ncbi:MAG TPA: amidohydrolase family protein [Propionibacteriaceae bacterium]|jgi:L-fuconolactonase
MLPSPPVIDAHQHVWDLDRGRYAWLTDEMSPIDRTMTEDEVLPQLHRAGIGGVVLVQAADEAADTELMLDVADRYPQVVGVVAYVPLEQPEQVGAQLEQLAVRSVVVGVRNLIHTRPDPDFLLRPAVAESLDLIAAAGFAFDVVSALPRHLELVPLLSEAHPELRLVVDHLSRPPIGQAEVEPWWSLIARAAASPQVSAKVSGLYPDADRMAWSTELVRPFVERALEVFGPERLMYGGDWPISVLAGGYQRVWDGLRPFFDALDAPERTEVLGGTARRIYRLDADRLAAAAGSWPGPDAGRDA